MSVTNPTLKLLGFTLPPLADVPVPAALDELVAAELDEVAPPPPAALLVLLELLEPHAARAKAATTPTVHIPR
jgi:hypothetical protein